LSDRLGRLKLPQLEGTIWIHAVSVGEVRAVEKLLSRIRQQFPGRPLVVSTTTPTGQQLARDRRDLIDHTFYFPLDLPGAISRTLDRVRPQLVIIAETEIWPNFLRICRQRNVPVMMINGRISDKSLPGYAKLRRWLRPVLDNYLVLGMQSEQDRDRIESIGAKAERIAVFGNLKYDIMPPARPLDPRLVAFLKNWPELWIAASTMAGEDELVLDSYIGLKQSRPGLKLMLAPRHPDRAGDILELIKARQLIGVRRSALTQDGDVLVLDTVGELASCFEFASIVFVGGSLVERGGHNVLEPASHSKPVVFGPHMENFREISKLFLEAQAAIQIEKASELAPTVARVLGNPSLANSLGREARQLVTSNAGATDRVMTFIRDRVFNDNDAARNIIS
jgi:3-deoxy-D-manno-octulosonic-acid transferase